MTTDDQALVSSETQVFLDSCLWDKNIRNIPEVLRHKMIDDLAKRLNAWLLQAAARHLEAKDIVGFEEMVGAGEPTQEQMTKFLRAKIPNIELVFKSAMLEFKQTFLQK